MQGTGSVEDSLCSVLKEPTCETGKGDSGLRGQAIAMMSVLAKWYAAVVVGLLQEEPEPVEWRELYVGAEIGVSCEHVQALSTNIPQRHWEWQEDQRDGWGSVVPQVPNNVLELLGCVDGLRRGQTVRGVKDVHMHGVHGHVVAALWAEMDGRMSACLENCETEFRCSRCIRQGSVEAPVLWKSGQMRAVKRIGK